MPDPPLAACAFDVRPPFLGVNAIRYLGASMLFSIGHPLGSRWIQNISPIPTRSAAITAPQPLALNVGYQRAS
jgi:hypothetical protein